ncbi:hypothetical protein TNCV_3734621 [Trichonephila clavipes]|nr:hypothetical protein TNCV_3734621 [Trichonephila clavipes]
MRKSRKFAGYFWTTVYYADHDRSFPQKSWRGKSSFLFIFGMVNENLRSDIRDSPNFLRIMPDDPNAPFQRMNLQAHRSRK